MHEHEVDRTVADDLVCDADVAAARVRDVGPVVVTREHTLLIPRGSDGARLRGARQVERRILAQHPALDLAQRGGRLHAEVVGQRPPERLVTGERLGLPARAVEREHVLRAHVLAQRVLGDQRLEVADRITVKPECQVGFDAPLERHDTRLLETRALVSREGLRELGQRTSAPQRESIAEQLPRFCGAALREHLPSVADRALEAGEIELILSDLQQVAGRTRLQAGLGEHLAQLRDVDLHHLQRRFRHPLAPERVDDLLTAHRAIRVQEQQRQQRPLLARRDRQSGGAIEGL